MTEVQVITILATTLGIIATVLNLVAFVREKDRSHTRAGFLVLAVLLALVGVLLLPRYAPGVARQLAARLPAPCRSYLEPWLTPATPTEPRPADPRFYPAAPQGDPTPTAIACPLTGSFGIEIRRNFFGGIGALKAKFQFVNLSSQAVRVTSFRIRITERLGEAAHSYERVLTKPVTVLANANAQTEVELNAEIRDPWVAWHNLEVAKRGPIEIRWECQDAQGNRFSVISSNG